MDDNSVKISKIVNIGLDINITDSLTVCNILDTLGAVISPEEQEQYILSDIAKQLIHETKVDWTAMDDAYYLLKLEKRNNSNGIECFREYRTTLYPGTLRDHRVRLIIPEPGPIDDRLDVAEWQVTLSDHKDILSAYPTFTCSRCGGTSALQKTPYCPYCGRKMTNGYYYSQK